MADNNIFTVTGAGLGDLGTQLFDPEKWGEQQAAAQLPGNPAGNAKNFYESLRSGLFSGAGRQTAANPFNTTVADQSRQAQLALINQMRGQMNGPSLAAMQGQRAMAQSGQQALGAAAMGAPARAAMLNAQQVGGGLAGDVGQARLAEVMRAQAGMGGAAGALRGNDLRAAEAQSSAGNRAQGLVDAMSRFYGSQGSSMNEALRQAALERYKLAQRLQQRNAGIARQTGKDAAQAGATILDIIF